MCCPDTLGAPLKDTYNADFADAFEHGVAVAAWDLGLPRPLAVWTTLRSGWPLVRRVTPGVML